MEENMIWWLPLVLVIPVFFLWAVVHEASHAIGAKIEGLKITSFKPYPNKSEKYGWRFASYGYKGGTPSTKSRLAPYVSDVFAFAVMSVLSFIVVQDWAWTVMATITVAPMANTVNAVQGAVRGKEGSDLMRVHKGWRIVVYALSLIYVMVFSAIMYQRFV